MERSRRRQMAWTRPRPNMGKRSCLCFPEAPRWLPERLVRTTEAITGRANETTQDPGDSLLPTAQQIQALLQMACENSPNLPTASPTNILVSLLLLLNQISYMNAVVFWAYVCS